MKSIQYIVSKSIIVWLLFVSCIIAYSSKYFTTDKSTFYSFGPNDNLKIIGVPINNYYRYVTIVIYSFINSGFRTLYSSVLKSWLINTIQDETKVKTRDMHVLAYEITCVTTVYVWFDWLLYMNILLSQIDLVIIEICADLLMSLYSTRYYLRKENYTLITDNL